MLSPLAGSTPGTARPLMDVAACNDEPTKLPTHGWIVWAVLVVW